MVRVKDEPRVKVKESVSENEEAKVSLNEGGGERETESNSEYL